MNSVEEYFNEYHNNSYHFDLLVEIILISQITKEDILNEWNKVEEFFKEYNPLFNSYQITGSKNLNFREDFLLDSYIKVYKQVSNEIKRLSLKDDLTDSIRIYYYYYEKELLNYWSEEGVKYGEVDKRGMVNTGSCLVVQYVDIDWKLFLKVYKGINN